METFVGLDVSLKEPVRILNQKGTRIFKGKIASEPAAVARMICKRAPGVVRVDLESGATRYGLPMRSSPTVFRSSVSTPGVRRRCCRCDRASATAVTRVNWRK